MYREAPKISLTAYDSNRGRKSIFNFELYSLSFTHLRESLLHAALAL